MLLSELHHTEITKECAEERDGSICGVLVPLLPCTPNYTPYHYIGVWEARPFRVAVQRHDIHNLHKAVGRNTSPAHEVPCSIQTMRAVNSNKQI